MAKKTNRRGNVNKNAQTKSNLPLLIAAIVAVCLAVIIVVVSKDSKRADDVLDTDVSDTVTSDTDEEADSSEDTEAQIIESGGSLVIPKSEISTTTQFYPIEVDGTRMEVIAVKDSEGNIRTAFNTCQVCYSSGRGYYVQDGDVLVCQNCGNRFTIDQVGIESGGCNPWPIFEEDRTETEDSIEISYDFLQESETIFARWKTL